LISASTEATARATTSRTNSAAALAYATTVAVVGAATILFMA